MKEYGVWLVLLSVMLLTIWGALSIHDNLGLFSGKETLLSENEWKVVQQADSTEMIRVNWNQNKEPKTTYCRVIFQSETKYKLVAPWITLTMEKTSANGMRYFKESFDPKKIKNIY